VTGDGVGVVGFCMGGMLTWILAARRPDKVKAGVAFYGYPQGDMEPDWSQLDAAIRGHMAENDDFFGPEGAKALESKLTDMGKDVSITVHAGTGHAFMGPHNAFGTRDEVLAAKIWPEVVSPAKRCARDPGGLPVPESVAGARSSTARTESSAACRSRQVEAA
jgi:carboxymethylenebutenolidase